jgi:hypothetical protein
VAPSGIVLPTEQKLTLTRVAEGLYIVEGASAQEVDFFSQPALYRKEPVAPKPNADRECPAQSDQGG